VEAANFAKLQAALDYRAQAQSVPQQVNG